MAGQFSDGEDEPHYLDHRRRLRRRYDKHQWHRSTSAAAEWR
jgi:hypothetical protein